MDRGLPALAFGQRAEPQHEQGVQVADDSRGRNSCRSVEILVDAIHAYVVLTSGDGDVGARYGSSVASFVLVALGPIHERAYATAKLGVVETLTRDQVEHALGADLRGEHLDELLHAA